MVARHECAPAPLRFHWRALHCSTILSEGEAGDTAFLIIAGSVEVSIGEGAKLKSVGINLGQTMTVRSVLIIAPSKRIELIISYPAYIGRSFNEILRVLDALQLSAKYRVATPANWQPGDDTVVLPFISDEEAERMFADQGGFRKVRSYLRFVRDPSLRILY